MSLHIILGFTDAKQSSEPTVVYAGRSGPASREAMARSASASFLVLNNPLGLRKNNPLAEKNTASHLQALRTASAKADAEAQAAAKQQEKHAAYVADLETRIAAAESRLIELSASEKKPAAKK